MCQGMEEGSGASHGDDGCFIACEGSGASARYKTLKCNHFNIHRLNHLTSRQTSCYLFVWHSDKTNPN